MRYRYLLPLGGFALLLVVLLVGLVHSPDKDIIPSPLIGKSAPQFSLPNLFVDQKPVNSALLKGRWSLINVWGTWCFECRAEQATLLQIEQQGQVPIIGIDWKDSDADAMSWLGELGNPFERIGEDHDGRVAIDWGVYGAPESFLISPAGTVVYKYVGPLTPQVWQREFLPRMGPSAPGTAASATTGGA